MIIEDYSIETDFNDDRKNKKNIEDEILNDILNDLNENITETINELTEIYNIKDIKKDIYSLKISFHEYMIFINDNGLLYFYFFSLENDLLSKKNIEVFKNFNKVISFEAKKIFQTTKNISQFKLFINDFCLNIDLSKSKLFSEDDLFNLTNFINCIAIKNIKEKNKKINF